MVADALSRKSYGTLACIAIREWKMIGQLSECNVDLCESDVSASLYAVVIQSTIVRQVLGSQQQDDEATSISTQLASGETIEGWSFDIDLGLRFHGCTFVPVASRELVMTEFHHSRLAVHPGGTKMYHDLCRQYWWSGMKRDVANFVARCLTCKSRKNIEDPRDCYRLCPLPNGNGST